ncbi:MAG: hypothetical protein H6Q69_1524 [Firmicutes bacterium]|nr:hypothetical protein [Bacillota bacterium]
MDDDYVGNFLYSILGDDAIESDLLGNLFVVSRLGTYYTTAAGTKEDWLARQPANADGLATVYSSSDRNSASLPQTDPDSSAGLDATAVPVQTSNNSSVAWYDRTWRGLKAVNPGWSDQQVTNEMTQQINLEDWNHNYKKLITDIANSSSAAEWEQKISDHKSELDAYRDSGINVDNDLKYLRNTQGEAAGQGEMLNQDLNVSLADAKPPGESPNLIQILAERLQYNFGTNSSSSVSAEYMVSPDSNVYGESPVTEEETKAGIHLNEAGIKVNSEGIPLPEEIDKIDVRERVDIQSFYESGVASIGEFYKRFGESLFEDRTEYQKALLRAKTSEFGRGMLTLAPLVGSGGSFSLAKSTTVVPKVMEEIKAAEEIGAVAENIAKESSNATTVLADEVKVLAESPWTKGPIPRGNIIDEAMGNNLGRTFPTVDKLENGVLTSTKSLDVLAPTYQNEASLLGRLKADIDTLSSFAGGRRSGVVVKASDYTSKVLELVLPAAELTAAQLNAINMAKQYASELGIGFRIVVVK